LVTENIKSSKTNTKLYTLGNDTHIESYFEILKNCSKEEKLLSSQNLIPDIYRKMQELEQGKRNLKRRLRKVKA
jgi:hypothetical protein